MWGGQKGGLEAEPLVGSRAPGQVKLPEAESLLVLLQQVSTEKWSKA